MKRTVECPLCETPRVVKHPRPGMSLVCHACAARRWLRARRLRRLRPLLDRLEDCVDSAFAIAAYQGGGDPFAECHAALPRRIDRLAHALSSLAESTMVEVMQQKRPPSLLAQLNALKRKEAALREALQEVVPPAPLASEVDHLSP